MDKEKLVKITIGQKYAGNKNLLDVWVREQDQFNFDLMFQRNVQVEAEKKAKIISENFIAGAISKALTYLNKLP